MVRAQARHGARARTLRRPGLALLADAARGLHGAHEAVDENGQPLNVVHRDVSPRNIHVSYDAHVKVVDFGIAAARGRLTRSASGQLKGTFSYLAPEQIVSKASVDRRADVWAIGVVAWEAISGRSLFQGDDSARTLWNVLNCEVPPIAQEVRDLPGAAVDVITACIQRTPEKRPSTCREVADAFEECADALGASTSSIRALMSDLFDVDRSVERERLQNCEQPGDTAGGTLSIREAQARAASTRPPAPWRSASAAAIADRWS